jgi:hypothetical protein
MMKKDFGNLQDAKLSRLRILITTREQVISLNLKST